MGLFIISGCNDSIRSRSTISQDLAPTTSTYQAELSPKVGLVVNEFINGEKPSIQEINHEFKLVKSAPFSTYRKITYLKVDGDDVYKLIESKSSPSSPVEREVSLETINLKQEMSEMQRTGAGKILKDKFVININESMSDPLEVSSAGNQFLHQRKSTNYQAVFVLSNPHCHYNTSLVTTTELLINGEITNSLSTEETRQAFCGEIMSRHKMAQIDLKEIRFCDRRNNNTNCEIKNLSDLVN
jgi:hypothetical protein